MSQASGQQGDILETTFTVENVGETGSQVIELVRLDTGGVVSSREVALTGGETQQKTIEWDTAGVPTDTTYTLRLESVNDTVTFDVTLGSPGFTLTNQQATVGIPEGGVSWWTFDNEDTDSGTAFDQWGSNDGTINGATTGVTGANQTYATNEAYSFNETGGDDISTGLNITSEFTVAAWVKPDSLPNTYNSVLGSYNSSDGIILRVEDTGTVQMFINNSGTDSTGSITTGSWSFIAGSHTSDDQTNVYINTNEDSSPDGADPTLGGSLDIGSRGDNTAYWNGQIDDVRVYDKALTSQEVANLYNNGDIRVE